MASITMTLTQLKAEIPPRSYTNAFYVAGQSGPGETFAQHCLDSAIAEATAMFKQRGAFPDDLPDDLASHPLTLQVVATIAYANAQQFYPGAADSSAPPTLLRKRAGDLVDRICADRLRVTDSGERPNPRASASGFTTYANQPTDPYARSANGSENGGY